MVTAKEEYENELEIKKNDNDEQRAIWESSHRFLTDRFQQIEADHYIIVSENVLHKLKCILYVSRIWLMRLILVNQKNI